MKDLMCDVCCREIGEDEEYIETDVGDVYCSDDCLLEDLEQSEKNCI